MGKKQEEHAMEVNRGPTKKQMSCSNKAGDLTFDSKWDGLKKKPCQGSRGPSTFTIPKGKGKKNDQSVDLDPVFDIKSFQVSHVILIQYLIVKEMKILIL